MSDATMARLTLDSLRETLQQAGYRVEAVADPLANIPYLRSARDELAIDGRSGHRAIGIHALSRGCAVSLQFGDQIVAGANGTTRLTIRCSLRVNGEDDRAAGVTCWQIRKSFYRRVGSERLEFAIEADVILGSGIALADVLALGRDVYRHLRLLITDARDTLRDLHVADGSSNGAVSPVLLIEAKFLGDLAVGRSGLVASSSSDPSGCHLRITAAACDWLKDGVLPDLARAVRAMILQVSSSLPLPTQAEVMTESHPCPNDQLISFATTPPIVPALEPVQ
ncbi:MAG: hypothetical protein JWP25_5040 [Bradyrhizobium sp.]|jgi:hypothetical protein|nr:hypothetical protein [Bradyrhizobium sp.]